MALRTYGSLQWFGGHRNKFILDVEPHVSIRFKNLFPQVAKNKSPIEIAHSPLTCKDILWFMERYPLNMDEETYKTLTQGTKDFDDKVAKLEEILLPNRVFKKSTLVKEPRDYQKTAIELCVANGALLCADDVGLGKTIVGIGVIVEAGQFPAMVVCQTHLPTQWKEKLSEFAPHLTVHIVKSRKMYTLPPADVYIMGYSKLMGWSEAAAVGTFKTIVFDEIQELRNHGSEKYQTAEQFVGKAKTILGLSATPIYNYGGEIYSVMNIVKPECLGNWWDFSREWGHASFGEKLKIKDPKALGTFMRENYLMIRRTRKDVARELPPVNKVIHNVEYDENLANKSEKELQEIARRVISGSFIERGMAARELDIKARMITGIAKAQGVAEYVKILLENNEKVLLVGWHRAVYDIWMKELKEYNPLLYTGSESPTQKEKTKSNFISGKSNLMILSLRSGIGLDGLQDVCDLVVFGELDWSPGVHEQVIGRVHRDGQQAQVTALFLITENGTDPLMVDILGLKSSQAQGIMNPTNEIEMNVSDDERLKKLARSILERGKNDK